LIKEERRSEERKNELLEQVVLGFTPSLENLE